MKQVTVSVPEAQCLWRLTLQSIRPAVETISYADGLGRITAAPLVATQPYPPYRKSPFDGYALGRGFTDRTFTVIATIGAGEVYDEPVRPDEAVRLMTGCAVPDDCATVVMQEHVTRDGDTLTVTIPVQAGENIIPIGEECQTGTVLAPPGTVLTSGLLAGAVGLGCHQILVYQLLRVLLLTSGHELIAPHMPLTKGKIYNSNGVMLRNLIASERTATVTHYHVSDAPERLDAETAAVQQLSQNADLIISTGGVSVGLYDTMPDMYAALGATQLYNRIAMRPGSASYGGYIRRENDRIVPILGLSGNPSAAFNAYHLLALPVLRRLSGIKKPVLPVATCRLQGDVKKQNPVDRYVQGRISFIDGKPLFTPNQVLTSSALLGLGYTNGLAMIPKGTPPCRDGDSVQVLILP